MKIRSVAMVVAVLAAGVCAGNAQAAASASASAAQVTAASTGPVFDVASVRLAAPMDREAVFAILRTGRRPETMAINGDRATFKYMSLKELVAYGYKVRTFQVTGPDWLTTDRFDIQANLPAGASHDDVPAMLKALLDNRFKLSAHLETKDHPVIGLKLAKDGAKMKETAAPAPLDLSAELGPGETKVDSVDGPMILTHNKNGSTTYNMGTRGKMTLLVDGQSQTLNLSGDGMTMKGLAMMLTVLGGGNGREVVDMTGLKGNYDVSVSFSLEDLTASLRDSGVDIPMRPGDSGSGSGASDPGNSSTVADALGKLGLKMTGTHAPVEQLVIDHVEKLPTEN
jgi:uncharacterized protein (TIGR03435 family)